MECDWQARAACAGTDTAVFFDHQHQAAAVALCGTCPVRAACLAAALAEETDPGSGNPFGRQMRHGVRGGLTSVERFAMVLPGRFGRYVAGYRQATA